MARTVRWSPDANGARSPVAPPSSLYEHAIRFERDASIAENGALVAYSGVKTGGSPTDKRVVGVPQEILVPRGAWTDERADDAAAQKVAGPVQGQFQNLRVGRQRGNQGRRSGLTARPRPFGRGDHRGGNTRRTGIVGCGWWAQGWTRTAGDARRGASREGVGAMTGDQGMSSIEFYLQKWGT